MWAFHSQGVVAVTDGAKAKRLTPEDLEDFFRARKSSGKTVSGDFLPPEFPRDLFGRGDVIGLKVRCRRAYAQEDRSFALFRVGDQAKGFQHVDSGTEKSEAEFLCDPSLPLATLNVLILHDLWDMKDYVGTTGDENTTRVELTAKYPGRPEFSFSWRKPEASGDKRIIGMLCQLMDFVHKPLAEVLGMTKLLGRYRAAGGVLGPRYNVERSQSKSAETLSMPTAVLEVPDAFGAILECQDGRSGLHSSTRLEIYGAAEGGRLHREARSEYGWSRTDCACSGRLAGRILNQWQTLGLWRCRDYKPKTWRMDGYDLHLLATGVYHPEEFRLNLRDPELSRRRRIRELGCELRKLTYTPVKELLAMAE